MTGVVLKICWIFAICCIPSIWTIHVIVPEHTSNDLGDTLEMMGQVDGNKSPLGLRQQSVKYQLNSEGSTVATSSSSSASDWDSANSRRHYYSHHLNAIQQQRQAKTSQLRRHHTSYDKNDDVFVGRHNSEENENIFENLEAPVATHTIGEVVEEEQLNGNDDHSQVHSRQRRELSDWLIAPNTRWCGRGNTANGTYNHLGGASMADKCCRKHDHCKVYIGAMSNKYGLFNYRPYTLSHCSCDRRFRTCLKMANDEDAKTIGQLFFNMVQTQCFTLSKERVCQERAADGTCAREQIKQKAHLRNNKKF